MTNRTHAGIAFLALALGASGCDGAHSPAPTGPSTPPPQQTPRPAPGSVDTFHVENVILSGMVYEVTPMGRVPIEGVRVQADYFHILPAPDIVTDSHGAFTFKRVWVCPCSWAPWVDAGITAVGVDKDGYTVPAGQPASVFGANTAVKDSRLRDVTIDGDTRFDIELVRQ